MSRVKCVGMSRLILVKGEIEYEKNCTKFLNFVGYNWINVKN